jgi:hypothetical protein
MTFAGVQWKVNLAEVCVLIPFADYARGRKARELITSDSAIVRRTGPSHFP